MPLSLSWERDECRSWLSHPNKSVVLFRSFYFLHRLAHVGQKSFGQPQGHQGGDNGKNTQYNQRQSHRHTRQLSLQARKNTIK